MAIMTIGSIAGSVSGDIGGISFSNPKGSIVVRKKRRGNSLTSRANTINQTLMMNIRRAWSELSDDNKNTWRTAASNITSTNRLGVSRSLSGYQYYMQYNLVRSRVLAGTADVPIASPSVGVSGVPTVTSTVANGIRIQFLDEDVPPALEINIYGRNLFRDTPIKFSNSRTFVDHFSPGIPADFFINASWSDVLGLPVLDQFIYLRIVLTDSANFQPHTFFDVFEQTTA